jgi:hypothetical protein
MADVHAIRAAIAAKALVTGVNAASADELDSALDEPVVLVTHTTSFELAERGLGYELRKLEISGELAVSRAALLGTAAQEADDIVERLFVAFRTGILLSMATIVQDSWLARAEQAADITIGGVEYVGYRLTWSVIVKENVTRTA